MESTALEEKINKIRLRNEEIKRRHEEVEADKKNAAKLDALVEPLPVEDWPERKEPPEFSAPPSKHSSKPKHIARKHADQGSQYYSSGDAKKAHNFADGQGPPPDPKYNFLADSEREEYGEQIPKDSEKNRGRNKPSRGGFRRRGSGRDWHAKEQWGQHANPGDMTLPEYEAWRAERNRIDEARISRQRTAEGNWRREWDNDKVHLADDVTKRDNRVTLGEIATRHEHVENEKHYRSPRGAPRNSHVITRDSHHVTALSETSRNHSAVNDPEKRVVIATDKSIKVMVNHGTTPPKSSVMSVKVSAPNIAGTGRVGPRQRPRVMYSSQTEAEAPYQDGTSAPRQKSLEERTKARQFDQAHKITSPKSPHAQRRRDGDAKSPYTQRRDNDKAEGNGKANKKDSQKSPFPQRRGNASVNYPPKSPRVNRRSADSSKQKHNSEAGNVNCARDASKIDDIVADSSNSQDSSAAIGNEKSSNSINRSESNDDKNDSVLPKESLTDASVTSTSKPVSESMNNDSENDKIEEALLDESAANSAIETVQETAKDPESPKKECPDVSFGEASGSGEAKNNSAENIDGESSDSRAINCSVNSGTTSNDSGYIELSSDNSIHDVSENETVETSGIGDTSSESLNISGQIAEDQPPVGNLEVEVKVSDDRTVDAAEPSSSNSEKSSESVVDNPEVKAKVMEETAVDAAKPSSNDLDEKFEPGVDNPEAEPNVTEEPTVNPTESLTSNSNEKSEPMVSDPGVEQKVKDQQTTDAAEPSSSTTISEPDKNKSKDTIIDTNNTASVELELQAEDSATSAVVPEGIDDNSSTSDSAIAVASQVESEQESNSIPRESDLTKDSAISGSLQSETRVEKAENSASNAEADNNRQDASNDNVVTAPSQSEKRGEDAAVEKSPETAESTQEAKSDESRNSNANIQDDIAVADATSSPAIQKD